MSNRTVLRKWSEIEVGVASLQQEIDALTVASTQYSRGWFQQLHVKGNAQFLKPETGGFLTLDSDNYLYSVPDFHFTGWPDTPGVTIAFDNATRTLTVTDGGAAYYYIQGVRYDLDGNHTVQITDTEGEWYFYFDGATLTASQTIWHFSAEDAALVAIIYWDATNNKEILLGYELHNYIMDGATHERMHYGGGAAFDTGLFTSDAGGGTINVTAGTFYDEDIRVDITDGAGGTLWEQVLSPAELPVYYRDGAAAWRIYETAAKAAATDVPYVDGANDAHYNRLNAGVWNSQLLGVNKYAAYWVCATSDQTEPVFTIMGQRTDNTLAAAKENNVFSGLVLTGLPFQELVVLARVVLHQRAAAPHYAIDEIVDLRGTNSAGNSVTPIAYSHSALSNLGADDHLQYLRTDGTRALTANWDVGNFNITLQDLIIGDGRYIGSDSDTDAIQIAAGGEVTLSQTLILSDVVNAGVDTDKFLVLDATDNVDYRTGAEVLSDIGAAAAAHAASHQNGGADEISIAGLSGQTADPQTVEVVKNSGAVVSTRPQLNFIEGANITLTIADDAGNDQADITIASAAGVGEANTASNLGAGVGTYDGKVGVDLQFRSLVAASARISIALDAVNDEIDFDVSEANINHDNLGTRTHDGDTLQLDGVTSNGGAFDFTTSGTLTFSNTVALTTCVNAGVDTDKFLVLDSGDNIDFRTGAEVLSDIGAATAAHLHDGDTLQHDGVNSNGGDFDFTTTGDIRHIMGTGNALVITDVVTDDTNKKPAIRSEQYDSTGEPEGFTVIYVEAV